MSTRLKKEMIWLDKKVVMELEPNYRAERHMGGAIFHLLTITGHYVGNSDKQGYYKKSEINNLSIEKDILAAETGAREWLMEKTTTTETHLIFQKLGFR